MPGITRVHQDDIGCDPADRAERLCARRGDQHGDARSLQRLGEEAERVGRIVDDEDDVAGFQRLSHRCRSLPARRYSARSRSGADGRASPRRRARGRARHRARRAWPRCRAHSRSGRDATARRRGASAGAARPAAGTTIASAGRGAAVHSSRSRRPDAVEKLGEIEGLGQRVVMGVVLAPRRRRLADIGRQHHDAAPWHGRPGAKARARSQPAHARASKCRGGRGRAERPPARARQAGPLDAVSTTKPSGSSICRISS